MTGSKIAGSPDFLTGFGVPLFARSSGENEHGYIQCQTARNVVKSMLGEGGFDLSMLDWSIFDRSVTDIYKEFGEAIQEVFDHIHYHSENADEAHAHHFIEKKELQLLALITSTLSLIPYSEPKDGDTFTIPQKINGIWQMVKHEVERIQLTPPQFGSPYFAYGLKPLDNKEAQAQLVFMGTNPLPWATGAHHTLMADFMPFHSVGEHLYLAGQDKINEWVDAQYQATNKPVISSGHSLGGSLAVIAHAYQPDKVQARSFNPPFWLPSLQKTYDKAKSRLLDQGKEVADDPVIVFSQKGDMVRSIGFLLETDEHTTELKRPKVYQISSNFGDKNGLLGNHKDSYAAHSAANGLKIEEMDPKEVNSSLLRSVLTVLWQVVSVPIFIINAATMLIKAIIYYIGKLFDAIGNLFINKPSGPGDDDKGGMVRTPVLSLAGERQPDQEMAIGIPDELSSSRVAHEDAHGAQIQALAKFTGY